MDIAEMTETDKALLEFKEHVANSTLAQAQAAYDLACERIYKLLPILLGAASAIMVFGFGAISNRPALGYPLVFAGTWLCLVCSYVVIKGATSNEVMAGTNAAGLQQRLREHMNTMSGDGVPERAFTQMREDQLASVDKQIGTYSTLTSKRSKALDSSYRALVIGTPAALAAGYIVALRWSTP